jgi:hypothetical protein
MTACAALPLPEHHVKKFPCRQLGSKIDWNQTSGGARTPNSISEGKPKKKKNA